MHRRPRYAGSQLEPVEGGGDASVSADLIPNTSSPFAGGTITVYSDGSFDLVTPAVPGTYTFDYHTEQYRQQYRHSSGGGPQPIS